MGSFSLIHWLILGVVILLLFGGNRFSAMMSAVAKGHKSCTQGLTDDDQPAERGPEPRALPRSEDRPIDVTPEPRRTADPVAPSDDQASR
jgi:sec-independent protein translocase protein TatA